MKIHSCNLPSTISVPDDSIAKCICGNMYYVVLMSDWEDLYRVWRPVRWYQWRLRKRIKGVL